VATVGAERPDERQYEERQPATHKRACDDAQRAGGLALSGLLALLGRSALRRQPLRTGEVGRASGVCLCGGGVRLPRRRCQHLAVSVDDGELERRRRRLLRRLVVLRDDRFQHVRWNEKTRRGRSVEGDLVDLWA